MTVEVKEFELGMFGRSKTLHFHCPFKQTKKQTYKHTNKQTYIQTSKQTSKQTLTNKTVKSKGVFNIQLLTVKFLRFLCGKHFRPKIKIFFY